MAGRDDKNLWLNHASLGHSFLHSSFEIYNIPLLALVFILIACHTPAENVVFTVVAYAWPWALSNQELGEKIAQRRLRLSFLGLIYRVYHYLQSFSLLQKKYGDLVARNLGPWIFIILVILLANTGNFAYAVLGTLSFEGFKYLVTWRRQKNGAATINEKDHADHP